MQLSRCVALKFVTAQGAVYVGGGLSMYGGTPGLGLDAAYLLGEDAAAG